MRKINLNRMNNNQGSFFKWFDKLLFGENFKEWLGQVSFMNIGEFMRKKI